MDCLSPSCALIVDLTSSTLLLLSSTGVLVLRITSLVRMHHDSRETEQKILAVARPRISELKMLFEDWPLVVPCIMSDVNHTPSRTRAGLVPLLDTKSSDPVNLVLSGDNYYEQFAAIRVTLEDMHRCSNPCSTVEDQRGRDHHSRLGPPRSTCRSLRNYPRHLLDQERSHRMAPTLPTVLHTYTLAP
jgi:hypothetical protein